MNFDSSLNCTIVTFLTFMGFHAYAGSAEGGGESLFCKYIENEDFFQDIKTSILTSERCVNNLSGGECDMSVGVRWEESVKINMLFGPGSYMQKETTKKVVSGIVSDLSERVEFKIELMQGQAGNFVIMYADLYVQRLVREFDLFHPIEDFNKLVESGEVCLGRAYINDDENIFWGVVFIPNGFVGDDLQACVAEEVFNLLGLTGDPEGYASFFDKWPIEKDNEGVYRLSEAHLAMIQLFYDLKRNGEFAELELKRKATRLCQNDEEAKNYLEDGESLR